jgi:hypothetical protein
MVSSILTFLGGSAFRMVWGEVASYINRKQDQKYELERMQLQADLDAAQHQRLMESLRFQADQQVKVIEVQGQQHSAGAEADGWLEAVKATGRSAGVRWVDAWNGSIRPGLATWGVVMLTLDGVMASVVLSEGTTGVIYAALGIYVADRTLAKRGK